MLRPDNDRRSRLAFIVGGAARSGTTSLTAALDRHPDLWLIKPYVPEPKIFLLAPERTPAEYLADIAARTRDAPAGRLVGEKTSGYFGSDLARARIVQTLPAIKLIFIVREPVARAYSNYLWSRRNGFEPLSFEEACAIEPTRLDGLPPGKSHVRPYAYLDRGRYGTYAQRWVEAVGRERVQFLLYEQLALEPDRLFSRVADFLGVRRVPASHLTGERLNISDPTAPPVSPELKRRLKAFFADEVARFASVSGEDVSRWTD